MNIYESVLKRLKSGITVRELDDIPVAPLVVCAPQENDLSSASKQLASAFANDNVFTASVKDEESELALVDVLTEAIVSANQGNLTSVILDFSQEQKPGSCVSLLETFASTGTVSFGNGTLGLKEGKEKNMCVIISTFNRMEDFYRGHLPFTKHCLWINGYDKANSFPSKTK